MKRASATAAEAAAVRIARFPRCCESREKITKILQVNLQEGYIHARRIRARIQESLELMEGRGGGRERESRCVYVISPAARCPRKFRVNAIITGAQVDNGAAREGGASSLPSRALIGQFVEIGASSGRGLFIFTRNRPAGQGGKPRKYSGN